MKALREEMIERFEDVDKAFERVDTRFEHIDKRFDLVDKRLEDGFAAVTEQLVEQRAYTEFSYERLQMAMAGGYDRLEKSIHSLSGGVARLERKLDRVLALTVESRSRNRL